MADIEFTDDILIQCPEISFQWRKAKKCFACQYYRGIARAAVNGEIIESDDVNDMQIVCGRPITRKLMRIEN